MQIKNLSYNFDINDIASALEDGIYEDDPTGSGILKADLARIYHKKNGVQYLVDESVSTDLIQTDVEQIEFEDLPLPARSIEFYFESPELPTVLMTVTTLHELLLQHPGVRHADEKDEAPPEGFASATFDSSNLMVYVQWDCPNPNDKDSPHRVFAEFSASKALELICNVGGDGAIPIMSAGIEKVPGITPLLIIPLLAKVIIYASIPQFAPRKLPPNPNKAEIPYGGKAGIKARPKRPSFRVINLPVEIPVGDPTAPGESTGTKTFRGRRGHFHYYRSDRFVNRKGTFDYFPPIPDPTGEKPLQKYRVRIP